MSAGLVLRATGSHLYPGARGSVSGAAPAGRVSCLVEFADGSAAIATLAPEGDGLVLETEPYTTARGTCIQAKRWRVALGPEGFRVLGR